MLPSLPRPQKRASKGLGILALFFIVLILVVVGIATYFSFIIAEYDIKSLPSISQNPREKCKETNRIYDAEGNLIYNYIFGEDRVYKNIIDIPIVLQHAVIASEDIRFYEHKGFDIRASLRALWRNLQSGEYSEGGSTITQQLARNVYIGTNEKTLTRKLKEILLARKIEQKYTKGQILEYYLNQVYFGMGAYGIESASQRYFGIPASKLNLAQASMLAGIITSPSKNNPIENRSIANQKQKIVLQKMVDAYYINDSDMEKVLQNETPLNAKTTTLQIKGKNDLQYFIDYVKERLIDEAGLSIEELTYGGFDIHTTLNQTYQTYAKQAIDTVMNDASKSGDFGKTQVDKLGVFQPQAALCAIDVDTGRILTMVGGLDYNNTQFNRCLALRQPGSSFKIFVYSAALDTGTLSPGSYLKSSPIRIGDWTPKEWFHGYFGTVTVRYAIQESSNICSIRAALRTGLKNVVNYAKLMGVKSDLLAVPSIAIGTVEVKPIEMASAGQTISNLGDNIEPFCIIEIRDRKIDSIKPRYSNKSEQTPAMSSGVAYDMIQMLKNVVLKGTGKTANVPGIPCAGKTGTTPSFRDGWFVGFTPEISAAVYCGSDSKEVDLSFVQNYGSKYSAVIWREFMKKVTAGRKIADWKDLDRANLKEIVVCRESNKLPKLNNTCPIHTILTHKPPNSRCTIDHPQNKEFEICLESGKLITEFCPNKEKKNFKLGEEPKEKCDIHTKPNDNNKKPDDPQKITDKHKPKDNQKPKPPDPKPTPTVEPEPIPDPEPEPTPEPEIDRFFTVLVSQSSARVGDIVRFDYHFNYEDVVYAVMYANGVQVDMIEWPWSIKWMPKVAQKYSLLFVLYKASGEVIAETSRSIEVTP